MSHTALIVPVPRVAPLIEPWARRHDPSFQRGVPPHVTVLFPFLPVDEILTDDLDALGQLCAQHPEIEVDLAQVGMFEDHEVLHLVPDPDEPFRRLTTDLRARWPHLRPYEGRHEDPAPHVTVGFHIPRPTARHAARSLMLALPIRVPVHVLQLWHGDGEQWHHLRSFPLGTPAP